LAQASEAQTGPLVAQPSCTTYPIATTTTSSSFSSGNMAEYKATSVQMAWDNHFAAFGAQDVDKIMLDYDEQSTAEVFDWTSGKHDSFVGLAQIREMFTALFAELSDLSTLEAPVCLASEPNLSVFLCWKCPSSGILSATDTFIFGENFKVKQQNIVVTRKVGSKM